MARNHRLSGMFALRHHMAINLYLADRYDRNALWPGDAAARGLIYQWSFWVMSEVEQALLTVLMHKRLLPAERRDADKVSRNTGVLKRPFQVLEQALAGRDFLLDDSFTLADLNVAAVLAWARAARMDLSEYPRLTNWLKSCTTRPAFRATTRLP